MSTPAFNAGRHRRRRGPDRLCRRQSRISLARDTTVLDGGEQIRHSWSHRWAHPHLRKPLYRSPRSREASSRMASRRSSPISTARRWCAGSRRVKASLAEGRDTDLNIVFILPMPALYQDEPFLHTRTINFQEMEVMAAWPECHGLNECFIKNLVGGEPMLRKLVDMCRQRVVRCAAMAPKGTEREVQAWGGWVRRLDDHEAVSGEEALARTQVGNPCHCSRGIGRIRRCQYRACAPRQGADLRRVSFCTDILSPVDLMARGSIDYCVRLCIELGVPPVTAVQMATLNSAECHQIDHDVGSLAPGRRADIVLLDGPTRGFHHRHGDRRRRTRRRSMVDIVDGRSASLERPAFAYDTVKPGEISAANSF